MRNALIQFFYSNRNRGKCCVISFYLDISFPRGSIFSISRFCYFFVFFLLLLRLLSLFYDSFTSNFFSLFIYSLCTVFLVAICYFLSLLFDFVEFFSFLFLFGSIESSFFSKLIPNSTLVDRIYRFLLNIKTTHVYILIKFVTFVRGWCNSAPNFNKNPLIYIFK